ncbi:MAG: Deoxyguanosinetriphosphate triphosphohydrolase-like protein [Phycisphaerae bacterium]|nr:Deoxyguanosinetriphosphate triphosphohydrolase-like protein [Phycisphaerae bacterium]
MTESHPEAGLLALATRQQIEQRERETLSPLSCRSADSAGRKVPEPDHPYRTAYQRDRDRVIHSASFRRLQYKTQVFVNHEGDHFRTRLTHTLEVAQISRTMARALRLNEDLAEAVALAHDLGHTPFGHSGEDALSELMAGHGGFEHNRHTMRIVDFLEERYPDVPGLNLSRETRECLAKHTTRYDKPISRDFPMNERPPLEGQIVDLADSIAYNSHDLEDALSAGLIEEEQCAGLDIWRELRSKIAADHPKLKVASGRAYERERQNRVGKALINAMVSDALATAVASAAKFKAATLDDIRRAPAIVAFSPAMARQVRAVEEFLWANVYGHYRVIRMAKRARRFMERLFGEFVREPRQLPPSFQARLSADGPYQVVCDYLAGMTDRFCQDEYKRLFEPFERT